MDPRIPRTGPKRSRALDETVGDASLSGLLETEIPALRERAVALIGSGHGAQAHELIEVLQLAGDHHPLTSLLGVIRLIQGGHDREAAQVLDRIITGAAEAGHRELAETCAAWRAKLA
jgi:hypothetical protein